MICLCIEIINYLHCVINKSKGELPVSAPISAKGYHKQVRMCDLTLISTFISNEERPYRKRFIPFARVD